LHAANFLYAGNVYANQYAVSVGYFYNLDIESFKYLFGKYNNCFF